MFEAVFDASHRDRDDVVKLKAFLASAFRATLAVTLPHLIAYCRRDSLAPVHRRRLYSPAYLELLPLQRSPLAPMIEIGFNVVVSAKLYDNASGLEAAVADR